MEQENVQNQQAQEELTDEQSDAEFAARLQGDEIESGDTGSPDAEPEGEAESREGNETDAEEDEAKPEQSDSDLRAERDALRKEIAKLRRGNQDERGKIAQLESEIEEVRKKLQQGESRQDPIDKWTVDETVKNMQYWRDQVDKARDEGDDALLKKSKYYLNIIEQRLPAKITESGKARDSQEEARTTLTNSVDTISKLVIEKLPDIGNEDSELFRESKAEFEKAEFKYLNEAVGPTIGSLLALTRAIVQNPDLVKGKSKVIKDVNKTLTKASMSSGSKNAVSKRKSLEDMSDQEQDELFLGLASGMIDGSSL